MNHLLRTDIRRFLVKLSYQVLGVPGVRHLVGRRYGGIGSILMWHSVVEDLDPWLGQDIRCSVDHLRSTLSWARQHGVDVLSMKDGLARLGNGQPNPFIVLTFDDGYRDNLTLAKPICERYGAPMTVFATDGLIRGEARYWWGGLVELARSADSIEIPGMSTRFDTSGHRAKRRALASITRWVQEDLESREQQLYTVFQKHGIEDKALVQRDFLSPQELQQLASSALVTVGAHATSHRILKPMEEERARAEIGGSKAWIEELIQDEVTYFAYPHGDPDACSRREAALVEEAGFRGAVSTRRGNLFPEHAQNPFLLPRGRVNPNRESPRSIAAEVAGLPRMLESRFRHPIDPDTIIPQGCSDRDQ